MTPIYGCSTSSATAPFAVIVLMPDHAIGRYHDSPAGFVQGGAIRVAALLTLLMRR
jgi:hypothetical protein